MSSYDKHLLDTLEPDERAAIEEAGKPENIDALRAIAGEGEGDTDDKDDAEGLVLDADGNPVADPAALALAAAGVAAPGPAAAPAAGAPAPAPVAAAPAAAAPAPAPAAPAAPAAAAPAPEPAPAPAYPTYTAALPADFDDQVAGLKTDGAALVAKFKAGEIDVETYQAEADKLNERREQLGQLKLKADMAEEINQQNAAHAWQGAINGLFTRAAAEGIDYLKDDARRGDLDTFVKALASRADTVDWPMSRFLDEAHKRVMALHGAPQAAAPAAAPVAAPAAAAPAAAPTPPSRTPPVDALPKSLAGVPGGEGPGDLAGEFADVDRLEGDALEDAIARMNPAQRERYMRGQ